GDGDQLRTDVRVLQGEVDEDAGVPVAQLVRLLTRTVEAHRNLHPDVLDPGVVGRQPSPDPAGDHGQDDVVDGDSGADSLAGVVELGHRPGEPAHGAAGPDAGRQGGQVGAGEQLTADGSHDPPRLGR